ncbi:hypothetical protein E4U42_005784 [Claviceps africana]|uniref:Uncharacterized protein n=1 Tax=Claviceps africana TaxID=83212 RepID=A0A8K0NFC0_9HYPO|nr:hypothetical protein E4U42_005784 [Claviceps africana]
MASSGTPARARRRARTTPVRSLPRVQWMRTGWPGWARRWRRMVPTAWTPLDDVAMARYWAAMD